MLSFLFVQMCQVPGYEQRLKAIIFKETFQEKIGEMKEVNTYLYNRTYLATNVS